MSEACSHDCSSCSQSCADRKKESLLMAPHKDSHIRKVIAVISGKGGVGKSLITGMMAVEASRRGRKTGILDADITGPSIPQMFGIHTKAQVVEDAVYPEKAKDGTSIMSINLLLEKETDPVIWRGPVIAGTVSQFWTEVAWGNLDYLFVDMPPGTGDVPLTVFQSLPVDGIIVVTSPQQLVSMIVEKAVHMANEMDIPILGIVENMSYFICPDCKKKHEIFGHSNIDEIAASYGIHNVVKIPLDSVRAQMCDRGEAYHMDTSPIQSLFDAVERK